MDSDLIRLVLEAPLREHLRRTLHRPPPSLADPRLDEVQADLIEAVIRETLDGLDLPQEEHDRALRVAAEALRRAAGETEHYDQMVPSATPVTSTGDGC
jgi:hypothetical protein